MMVARVIGTVVASRKDKNLGASALLLVQPLGTDGAPAGKPIVAVDSVGSGVGEQVFYVKGREAALPFLPAEVPTDAAIVGILREGHVVIPQPETVLSAGDEVIALASAPSERALRDAVVGAGMPGGVPNDTIDGASGVV